MHLPAWVPRGGSEVQVRATYTIPASCEKSFLPVMHKLRRVRLRSGTSSWQLLRHSGIEGRFVEEFTVGSWDEYQQLELDRTVVHDRALKAGRRRYPRTTYRRTTCSGSTTPALSSQPNNATAQEKR